MIKILYTLLVISGLFLIGLLFYIMQFQTDFFYISGIVMGIASISCLLINLKEVVYNDN